MQSYSPLDSNQQSQGIQLEFAAKNYLLRTAKWAKFLSIVGFIFAGIMVLASIFIGIFLGNRISNEIPGFVFTIIYLVIGGIAIPPILSLYRFSERAKSACNQGDSFSLTEALGQLHAHYRYNGILLIIVLSSYLLAILGGVLYALLQ